MPNTKVGKSGLKDFYHYHRNTYLVVIIIAWLLSDIVFSATRYTPPDERQVKIMAVSTSVDVDSTLALMANELCTRAKAFDPTLEEVVFQRIGYDPENDTDGYGGQQYMLMVGVAEGDVYMVPKQLMHVLVNEGYVLPLEGYIEQGLIEPGDVDLSKVTFGESTELDDYDPAARHVYAIPMENMNSMLTSGITYDNRDAYMVIMSFSANPETSAYVMGDLLRTMTSERPEWAQTPTYDTNAFDDVLEDAGFATPAPSAE